MKVAVIDDDAEAAGGAAIMLEDAGFTPIELASGFERVEDLVEAVIGVAQGALCDHRLSPHGYAQFSGAEAVATLYERAVPAVLITTYAMDTEVSIRKYRDRIPAFLTRDEMRDPDTLVSAFEVCRNELGGRIALERKRARTLVRVESRTIDSGEEVLDAIVPGWNPDVAVRFPVTLLPPDMQRRVSEGTRLFAEVNIGARRVEDVFFANFEPAPDLDDGDALA